MVMDYEAEHYAASGQRVTRRLVDPINFTCSVDLDFSPRIEDCWYETTCLSASQPRFLDTRRRQNGGIRIKSGTDATENDSAWNPNFMPTFGEDDAASKTNEAANKNSGKGASLGSFFQKSAAKTPVDAMNDNHSISSRSMNSRSVSDRSNAERSKSEKKLAEKTKISHENKGRHESSAMHAIDELSAADFSMDRSVDQRKPKNFGGGGKLGSFLSKGTVSEGTEAEIADNHSVVSGASMGSLSISKRSGAERSRAEKGLSDKTKTPSSKSPNQDDENSITMEEVAQGEKKFRFGEYNEVFEISYLPESVIDDLFWSSDELAEFRYEAFLEEAGLDIDEYM